MSQQHCLEQPRNVFLQLARNSNRLPYHRPKAYALGSLEQIQAYHQGNQYDGPNASYYYAG